MLSSAVAFSIALLLWESVLRRPLNSLPAAKSEPSPEGQLNIRTLWALFRPHTIKGTVTAVTTGYVLMYLYSGGTKSNVAAYLRILISGVLANVFIVAINQLTDVDIDKANGKLLPIAAGKMKFSQARLATGLSLCLTAAVSFAESTTWFITLSAMCAIGYAYSVPPLRLKRHAVPAALCIIMARAVLGIIGGTHAYCQAFGVTLDQMTNRQMFTFCGILIVFCTTVAIMKDIPDIKGDVTDNVNSFAVQCGAYRMSRFCLWTLTACYTAVIGLLADDSSTGLLHAIACVYMWGHWHFNIAPGDNSDAALELVKDNYLNTLWPLFYFEFIAYPLPIVMRLLSLPPLPSWLLVSLLAIVLFNSAVAMMEDAREERRCKAMSIPELAEIRGDVAEVESLMKTLVGVDLPDAHAAALDLGSSRRKHHLDRAAVICAVGRALGLDRSDGEMEQVYRVAQAAELEYSALLMHSELVQDGKVTKSVKLAVLGGDWYLGSASVVLADTGLQPVVQEMSDAIAEMTAHNTETKEKPNITGQRRTEFNRLILKHACRSLGHLQRCSRESLNLLGKLGASVPLVDMDDFVDLWPKSDETERRVDALARLMSVLASH
ncbi:hypoxanthine-guanine phosphoribosyltransferase [Perkinsus olseni]|uniref:Hypoxanthine-guanine phosphoribosyltransferase n=1 Tax=Perkinsus olseni TaxID=32597 RepID=A0A7J6UKE4_PEROL|nr:hypoxanthine-guanine phosphoribosyltransferase [Perkinsus olseni]KAF4757715.1 hypoxanthine-guanine phosphoribosyltransferase [Perkinsus olseni]